MDTERKAPAASVGPRLIVYWMVVSLPLLWGIWKTAIKLPALFQ